MRMTHNKIAQYTDTDGRWEERWHPLREEWVIVAAHRQNRPWTGETLAREDKPPPAYDPTCYLCPGNERVSGARNPNYSGTFVFDNDHPCVDSAAPHPQPTASPLFRARPAHGRARVICYDPRHDLGLAQMPSASVESVVATWQREYEELGADPQVQHVLIFENRGEAVGVSNPHPHGQIYATNFVFKTIETEARASQRHHEATGRSLLGDVIEAERADGRRIVCENERAVAFIPWFGRWAYELFVAPKVARPHIAALTDAEAADFAALLREVLVRFDNLWRMPFPYVMALHQSPTDGGTHGGFHFHVEFHPPLRKPHLRKYLAGPEIGGGNFLSDTAPEEKAAELRGQSSLHYTNA